MKRRRKHGVPWRSDRSRSRPTSLFRKGPRAGRSSTRTTCSSRTTCATRRTTSSGSATASTGRMSFKPFETTAVEFAGKCLGQYNTRHLLIPPANGMDYSIHRGYRYMNPIPVAAEKIAARVPHFLERAGYYFQNWDSLLENWHAKGPRDHRRARGARLRPAARNGADRGDRRAESDSTPRSICWRTTTG